MSASLDNVQVVFLDKTSISPDVKAVNLSLALKGKNLTFPESPRVSFDYYIADLDPNTDLSTSRHSELLDNITNDTRCLILRSAKTT